MVINEKLYLSKDCYLDFDLEIIMLGDIPCGLSRLQFRLLHILTVKIGSIVKYMELIDYTWRENGIINIQELRVFTHRLRSKIAKNIHIGLDIICVRNTGYILITK